MDFHEKKAGRLAHYVPRQHGVRQGGSEESREQRCFASSPLLLRSLLTSPQDLGNPESRPRQLHPSQSAMIPS